MSISLFDAACARWDSANLHESISPLRLDKSGGPAGMIEEISSGTSSPDGETLPRSRFCESPATLEETTSASKTYLQFFILTCYSLDLDDIKTYQDAIISAFENSHRLSTNPFALVAEDGKVNDLDYEEMQKSPGNAEIKYIEIVFRCRYTVPRVKPS